MFDDDIGYKLNKNKTNRMAFLHREIVYEMLSSKWNMVQPHVKQYAFTDKKRVLRELGSYKKRGYWIRYMTHEIRLRVSTDTFLPEYTKNKYRSAVTLYNHFSESHYQTTQQKWQELKYDQKFQKCSLDLLQINE